MYQQPYIDNGNLMIPISGGYVGIPLWFVGIVFVAVVGFIVVVALAEMSSKRRERP